MIKINLLSPLDKENLKWEKINNLTLRSIFWILIAEAFFATVFVFSLEYLHIEQAAVEGQLSNIENLPTTKDVKSMEVDMNASKAKIDGIYAIEKNHLSWTFLLDNISNLVPSGVRLDTVSVENDSPTKSKSLQEADMGANVDATADSSSSQPNRLKVEIVGNAKTRQDLLALEDNLKKSDLFTGLEYDDSNYVKSADIDFSYTFYVSRDKLLQVNYLQK